VDWLLCKVLESPGRGGGKDSQHCKCP
jgi:hypothetical protein